MKLLDLFPATIKANPLGLSGRVSGEVPGGESEQNKIDLVKSISTSNGANADQRRPKKQLHNLPK